MTKSSHGGKRPGAGRKAKQGEVQVQVAVRFPPSQLEAIKAAAVQAGVPYTQAIRDAALRWAESVTRKV